MPLDLLGANLCAMCAHKGINVIGRRRGLGVLRDRRLDRGRDRRLDRRGRLDRRDDIGIQNAPAVFEMLDLLLPACRHQPSRRVPGMNVPPTWLRSSRPDISRSTLCAIFGFIAVSRMVTLVDGNEGGSLPYVPCAAPRTRPFARGGICELAEARSDQ
jgi:hypothetical protein